MISDVSHFLVRLTVAFLQELVKQEDNQTSNEELDDDQKTDSSPDVAGVSVHASEDVDDGLTHSDHHSKQLLGSVEEGAVLGSVSNLNEFCSSQELHDQARGDDGGDTQLHESSSVGGEDDSDPVEWIRRVRTHNAKQGNLNRTVDVKLS